MRAGLTPNAVQWCRCGGLRGPNLAECVAVRRRFRAKVGVFWQSLNSLGRRSGVDEVLEGQPDTASDDIANLPCGILTDRGTSR